MRDIFTLDIAPSRFHEDPGNDDELGNVSSSRLDLEVRFRVSKNIALMEMSDNLRWQGAVLEYELQHYCHGGVNARMGLSNSPRSSSSPVSRYMTDHQGRQTPFSLGWSQTIMGAHHKGFQYSRLHETAWRHKDFKSLGPSLVDQLGAAEEVPLYSCHLSQSQLPLP